MYAVLNTESSGPIIWMIVVVNLVLFCGMVALMVILMGRANAAEMPDMERLV